MNGELDFLPTDTVCLIKTLGSLRNLIYEIKYYHLKFDYVNYYVTFELLLEIWIEALS